MPHRMFGRAVRHHIADLRALTSERNPWNDQPDGFLVAPLMVAAQQAAADLLEYLVDTHGPEEGTYAYRCLMQAHEHIIPKPLNDRGTEPREYGATLCAAVEDARDERAERVARAASVSLDTEPIQTLR